MRGYNNLISLLLASNAACFNILPSEKPQTSPVPHVGPFDAGWGYLDFNIGSSYPRQGISEREMQKNYLGVRSNGLPSDATADELHLFELFLPSQALPKDWILDNKMRAARNLSAAAYQNPKPEICLSHLCAMVAGHKINGSPQQGSTMFDADFFYFNPNAGDISPDPHSGVARGVFQWSWFKQHGAHLVYRGRGKGRWTFPNFANTTAADWAGLTWAPPPTAESLRKMGAIESLQSAFGFSVSRSWNGIWGPTFSKENVTNFTTINTTLQKLRDGGSQLLAESYAKDLQQAQQDPS